MPEFSRGPREGVLPPITEPYLLCLNVKSYRDASGKRYVDQLWHRDLVEHVRYLKALTLASPCSAGPLPPGVVACDPSLENISFLDLPASDTFFHAIVHLPWTIAKLWSEIGRTDLVHIGIAGWPIPLGWVAGPIALLRRKEFLVIVESAPWRLHAAARPRSIDRWRARLFEWSGRWCVNHAGLVIATQEEYCRSLLTRNPAEGHVIPACWLHDTDLLSWSDASASWRAKAALRRKKLKVLFAGRLARAKGLHLLLDGIRKLNCENAPIELDILGEGELYEECCETARSLNGETRLTMLGTVPYGEEFFRLINGYHAVAIPSLSDEQPRVVYDAFSQAVPVLANRTAGLLATVEEGRTGAFTASSNGDSWADLLRWGLRNPDELERMGMAGLQVAQGMTIRKMHVQRWGLLAAMLRKGENSA